MIASEYILQRINQYFRKLSFHYHQALLGDDSYPYMASPLQFVYDALTLINNTEEIKGKKFLDVGSGIGNVCGIAEKLGCQPEGIELNPTLCAISKEIYPKVKIHEMNIMNFTNYSDYDIIFYFYPLQDEKLANELKIKIENECRLGAYVIVEVPEEKDERFINLYNKKVWQKIKEHV